MLSLPGFVCIFFFISNILFNPGKPRLFSLPHHHTTYLSSSSLSAFFQSVLLNLPPPPALSHKHCHLYSKYLHLTPYTTHNFPSHLPFSRYTSQTHTTISPPLVLHNAHTHYHLTMPTSTPPFVFHQLRTYTTTTDGTHTGHASLSFSFPLENLFSCDSYCQ